MATQMAEPAAGGTDSATEHLTLDDRVGLLRAMLLMRGLEERAMTLYRQGKVPGSFYDGFGQEAVSVGAAFAMAPAGPPVHPAPRPRRAPHPRRRRPRGSSPSTWAARAASPAGATATCTSATARSGCVGMVSMLPDMMLVATGMAMAFKLRGEQRCAMTWFGDGSTSRGDFHEAMNWAGVQKLPVVFVLENNQYAYSTPLDQQFAVDPVERAAAYGFPGVTVDGNDVEAMFEADARRRASARSPATGPTLIEAVTMRMHGHAAHDDMKYVPKEQVEEWRKRRTRSTARSARLRELGVDVDGAARRGHGRDRRRPPRRRWRCRCPTRRPPPTACSATARPSRSATATRRGAASPRAVRLMATHDLPAGDLRRRCARRCAPTSACS